MKLSKTSDEESILKAARENKSISYKGTPRRWSVDFSAEILQARREWDDIFNMQKETANKDRFT